MVVLRVLGSCPATVDPVETSGEERWFQAFRMQAAHMAFPDWSPRADEWVSLYTSLVGQEASITTEIAVYRGNDRIRHRHYQGEEAKAFWLELMNRVAD